MLTASSNHFMFHLYVLIQPSFINIQAPTCLNISCTILMFSLVEYITLRTISYSDVLCSSLEKLELWESFSVICELAERVLELLPGPWSSSPSLLSTRSRLPFTESSPSSAMAEQEMFL